LNFSKLLIVAEPVVTENGIIDKTLLNSAADVYRRPFGLWGLYDSQSGRAKINRNDFGQN